MDELDRRLRDLEAERLRPVVPQPWHRPVTLMSARRNLLDLMAAGGGLTAEDQAWIAAHPVTFHDVPAEDP